MAAWLSKMFGALAHDEPRFSPRQSLLSAQRDRTKVLLEPLKPGASKSSVFSTTIEQVRDDDLVISQPVIGGLTHPLAFGEDLRLSFHDQFLHHAGTTRCLGRVKIPAGGHQTLFAYRLAIPETLQSEDRRRDPRVNLPLTTACEAHLYSAACDGPLFGRVVDISMGGAQVQTAMAADKIAPGQEVYLKSMLPEPVGLIDELVEVSRVSPMEAESGGCVIGLSFKRRIGGLAELIRGEQARQTQRAAG